MHLSITDYSSGYRHLSKGPGPRFIKLKKYELVLIAHLHLRIVKIQQVGQSARILPIGLHVKKGDLRGKSTRFYILVSGRPRSRELRDLVSFQLDKTGPRSFGLLRRGHSFSVY